MDQKKIQPGTSTEAVEKVTPELTTSHIGSGNQRVYATPAMVSLIERTCNRMLEPVLVKGKATVGIFITLKHLAPTPLGEEVHIQAEITAIEGNTVAFKFRLWDKSETVAEGEHRRAIIDLARFWDRVQSKITEA